MSYLPIEIWIENIIYLSAELSLGNNRTVCNRLWLLCCFALKFPVALGHVHISVHIARCLRLLAVRQHNVLERGRNLGVSPKHIYCAHEQLIQMPVAHQLAFLRNRVLKDGPNFLHIQIVEVVEVQADFAHAQVGEFVEFAEEQLDRTDENTGRWRGRGATIAWAGRSRR